MFNNTFHDLEWVWDPNEATQSILLKNGNREVCFHPNASSGTAAVRGNQPFVSGRQYYWELEMLTPLYGTDVMVGVGTSKVNLKNNKFPFGSLLGSDEESWGFSYRGSLFHDGIFRDYSSGFNEGSIVGIHLDMWLGSITFYLNRQPLGVAFNSIKSPELYPMVCSTSARSGMRIICATSLFPSLQFYCLRILGTKEHLVEKLKSIPGLCSYTKKAFWLFPTTFSNQTLEGEQINQFCCEYEERRERYMHVPDEIITGGEGRSDVMVLNRLQVEGVLHQTTGLNIEIYLDNNLYLGYPGT